MSLNSEAFTHFPSICCRALLWRSCSRARSNSQQWGVTDHQCILSVLFRITYNRCLNADSIAEFKAMALETVGLFRYNCSIFVRGVIASHIPPALQSYGNSADDSDSLWTCHLEPINNSFLSCSFSAQVQHGPALAVCERWSRISGCACCASEEEGLE